MIKLDLGCGLRRSEGFVRADILKEVNPDLLLDLNQLPYPFRHNSFDNIRMWHVLEHLNEPVKVLAECYRIAKPGARIHIRVPYWWKDIGKNPWHKHLFKVDWFKCICKTSETMELWKKYNFKIKAVRHNRGRINIFKIYEIEVLLEVVK